MTTQSIEQTGVFILDHTVIGKVLAVNFSILLAAHLVMIFLWHTLGIEFALGLVPLFHFDFENNIPTLYSGALLASCAILLFVTRQFERIDKPGLHVAWLFLSVGFAFMFCDEMFRVHERLGELLSERVDGPEIFYFKWLIPYLGLIAIVAAVLSVWFFRLDRWSQIWFAICGSIYLFGAVGMEMISGVHYASLDEEREVWRTLSGDLMATVEESLEMIGLSLFIFTLTKRLSRKGRVFGVTTLRV